MLTYPYTQDLKESVCQRIESDDADGASGETGELGK